MSKTTQLLLARRAEVEAEMAPFKAELKEIDAALAAIEGKPRRPRKRLRDVLSIGDQALLILNDYPKGLPTREIRTIMKEVYGREIAARNMSWHMSHLKRDKRVKLVGEMWRIRLDEDEAPGSSEPGASEHHVGGGGTPSSSGNGASAHSLVAPPGASPAHLGE